MQANIHNGSVLNYTGRLVAHRSNHRSGGNQGRTTTATATSTRNAENAQPMATAMAAEDISTVTAALQQHQQQHHQIISTVAAVEIIEGNRKGVRRSSIDNDVIRVDQQQQLAEDASELGLGAGGDSDQRLLLGNGNDGVGVTKEGSVGRKTTGGSKQKKMIFIRAGGEQSVTTTSGGRKEKPPMVTIVTIGAMEATAAMRNGEAGDDESEEDKVDILAHL